MTHHHQLLRDLTERDRSTQAEASLLLNNPRML